MDRIEWSPDICNGKPVIKGTRITVQTVLSHLSAGDSTEDLLEAFPNLSREDILASLAYAARVGEIHSSIELVS
ncbi:MAG TPA: antitoxin [Opitutae bacterium]|nr:antitoxin [Opitutae bacterium]